MAEGEAVAAGEAGKKVGLESQQEGRDRMVPGVPRHRAAVHRAAVFREPKGGLPALIIHKFAELFKRFAEAKEEPAASAAGSSY